MSFIEIKSLKDFINTLIAQKQGDPKAQRILQKSNLGQNYTNNVDGGYCMPNFLVEEIFKKYVNGGLINKVRKINSPNRNTNVSIVRENGRTRSAGVGGLLGYWVGEGVEKTRSKLQFDQVESKLNKCVVLNYVSDELNFDVPEYEELFKIEAGEEIKKTFERAILYGATATSMEGIFGSPGVVEVAMTTPTDAQIKEFIIAMAPECFKNACWYMSPSMYKNILDLYDDTDSAEVLTFPDNESEFGRLYGRPIHVLDVMEEGDLVLIDPTEYLVLKGTEKFAISADVEFLTDQTILKLEVKINGLPLWRNKRETQDGTYVSAFVVRSTASELSSSSSNSSSSSSSYIENFSSSSKSSASSASSDSESSASQSTASSQSSASTDTSNSSDTSESSESSSSLGD